MRLFIVMMLGLLGIVFANNNTVTVLDVKYVLSYVNGCSELGDLSVRKNMVGVINSGGGDMALLDKYVFKDNTTGAKLLFIDTDGSEYIVFTYSNIGMCNKTFELIRK